MRAASHAQRVRHVLGNSPYQANQIIAQINEICSSGPVSMSLTIATPRSARRIHMTGLVDYFLIRLICFHQQELRSHGPGRTCRLRQGGTGHPYLAEMLHNISAKKIHHVPCCRRRIGPLPCPNAQFADPPRNSCHQHNREILCRTTRCTILQQ
jgi:hypothetical protein